MPRPPNGRVGMVLETAFPPDARVEREALALIEAGYEVHLLCATGTTSSQPTEEVYRGIHVHRVDLRAWRKRQKMPFFSLWKSLWKRLTHVELDWCQVIKQFVQQYQVDVLHIHDLRLAPSALAALPQGHSVKVVADLHENYPALVEYLTTVRKGPAIARKKRRWWEQVEKRVLQQANTILVVVEEAQERLLRYPGAEAGKIHVVPNVVDTDKFLSPHVEGLTIPDETLFQDRFILCYVGYLNNTHRGIQTVLAALPLLRETIPNILFVGVGDISERYRENHLQPLIEQHQLENLVHFTGYCDESSFAPYIKQAHVGLCPHLKTELTDTTFPNKVYLYGLFGKPVIVSGCTPLVRYVAETQSGLATMDDSPEALAHAVTTLFNDEDLRHKLGQAGHNAVINRYNWASQKQALLDAYLHR